MPRKAAISSPRGSGTARGRPAGGGSGGFNHCRAQPVPAWQRPVAGFFQPAPPPSESAGDASTAAGTSTDPTVEQEPRPGSSNSNTEPCGSESPCRSSSPPEGADLAPEQPVSNGLISDDDDD